MNRLALEHHDLMKQRWEDLGWPFDEKDFWRWYDGSEGAAQAACENLRNFKLYRPERMVTNDF